MIIKFSSKFETWFKALKNKGTRASIHARFSRILNGNMGDCKSVGDKTFELRIDIGQGYRIYFCYHKGDIIILYGGVKKNQAASIKHAINIRKEMIQGEP